MLIKVYDRQLVGGPAGKMTIIPNVKDIIVHLGTYKGDEMPPTNSPREPQGGPRSPVYHRYETDTEEGQPVKYIDFTDEDKIRTRLCITHLAYICNDEGKTVEKVIVEQ